MSYFIIILKINVYFIFEKNICATTFYQKKTKTSQKKILRVPVIVHAEKLIRDFGRKPVSSSLSHFFSEKAKKCSVPLLFFKK